MEKSAKVVVLGAVGVGKSSLTSRFISDQFNQQIPTTLGAVYFDKVHHYGDGKSIKFQFWDTAGQEKFRSIARIYYKQAKAALILYDVSDKQSFQGLKLWVNQLRQKGPQKITLAIVGNKTDLLDHQVPITQAQQYAKNNNALFKLISVKQNKGIQQLFDELAARLDRPLQQMELSSSIVIIDGVKKKNKDKSCC